MDHDHEGSAGLRRQRADQRLQGLHAAGGGSDRHDHRLPGVRRIAGPFRRNILVVIDHTATAKSASKQHYPRPRGQAIEPPTRSRVCLGGRASFSWTGVRDRTGTSSGVCAGMANRDIVAIGTSAGGVKALLSLAGRLPPELPAAILITIHLPSHPGSAFDELLSRAGPLPATFAGDGET